jgi:hypothetical protein
MYEEGYGVEYRIWHLAQCPDCLRTVWELGIGGAGLSDKPKVDLHIRP